MNYSIRIYKERIVFIHVILIIIFLLIISLKNIMIYGVLGALFMKFTVSKLSELSVQMQINYKNILK